MANKLPWYTTTDWTSIIGFFIIVAIIIAILFIKYLPDITRNEKIENLKGQTFGLITDIKENTVMQQGHDGNKLLIESFTVKYTYKVNNVSYEAVNNIKGRTKNAYFLRGKDLTKIDSIKIKYNTSNPQKSLIIIPN